MAGDDSDEPDKPAAGTAPKLTKAEREARRKAEAEEKQRSHERERHALDHKVAWYAQVWVPFVAAALGFLSGMGTCASAYFQRDVRNQVWQATYEDKQRTLELQREQLKLQEDYLGKLKQLYGGEEALEKANKELSRKQAEADALKEESRQAMDALRSRYARLEAAERARIANVNATKAAIARRAPWRYHGCVVDGVYGPRQANGDVCDRGNRATFAKDTPDEKEVVQPSSKCLPDWAGYKNLEADTKRCETYARTFLTGKGGLTPDDIEAVLLDYRLRYVFGGGTTGKRSDNAADKALEEKFKKRK